MNMQENCLPKSFIEALASARKAEKELYDHETGSYWEADHESYNEFIDFYEKLMNDTLNDAE